jgi:hypothetical protein
MMMMVVVAESSGAWLIIVIGQYGCEVIVDEDI